MTEYQQVYGTCSDCHTVHYGSLPYGISNTLLGSRATASVAIFTGDYRLSKRSVQLIFDDFFNLPVSLGTISNAEKTVSAALEAPVEEAKVYIQQETCPVHASNSKYEFPPTLSVSDQKLFSAISLG